MPKITTSATICAPVGKVWSLLADFRNIEAWWPKDGPVCIERVECEGDGVGLIRHIFNVGMPGCVSERLDLLDPHSRTLILSIIGDRPAGITAYVARAQLSELTATSCRIDYCADVTTSPGKEDRVEKNIRLTWELMFSGLEAAAISP